MKKLLLVAIMFGLVTPGIFAATLTVTNTNDSGAGSLRDQIAAAVNGDVIVFDAALNGSTITLTSGNIAFAKSIDIIGPGYGQLTISGNSNARIFDITGGNVYIKGLTIINGSQTVGAPNEGGAIRQKTSGNLTLNNVYFSNNLAVNGNGSQGGAVYYQVNGGTFSADSCFFMNSSSDNYGGALSCNGGPASVILDHCWFDGNSANGPCGAFFTNASTVQVSNSTFSNNSASQKAAIWFSGSSSTSYTITNSTFSNNVASIPYGEFDISSGTLTMINCTYKNNSEPVLVREDFMFGAGTLIVQNSLFDNVGENFSTSGTAVLTSLGGNISNDGTMSSFLTGTNDQNTTDPMLGTLANNGGLMQTHVLIAGSPAIDNGINAGAPTTDQIGVTRSATVDAGSMEFNDPCLTETTNPVAVCQNITVYLDGAGVASITGMDLDGGSTDNCSIGTYNASVTSFTCADLGANSVTLTVTDLAGNSDACVSTVTVLDTVSPTISAPANVTVTVNASNCSATGVSLGTETAADNCSTPTVTNNAPATFPLGTTIVIWTATDVVGNTSTATQVVTVTTDLVVTVDSTHNVMCNGSADGEVFITVTGGTTAYTYAWDNSATTEDISGLAAGTYNVTVTDANGCTTTTSATIMEPSVLTAANTTINPSVCATADGAVNTTIAGGTAPYSYAWDNSAITQNLTNVGAGTYVLTVTDANGCTAVTSAALSDPSGPTIVLDSTHNVLCPGGSDGAVYTTVSGGTTPYSYAWDNSATTEDIMGVTVGTYNLTATDANGCIATASGIVAEPTALSLSATATDEMFGNDGTVTLTVSGGTAPYSYVWNNGATTANLSGLTAGSYSVSVMDANGCTGTTSITVASQVSIAEIGNIILNVYPNPTNGAVYIEFSQITDGFLTVYDAVGKIILKENITNSKHTFDLSDNERGIYFLKVESGNNSQVVNIVLQ